MLLACFSRSPIDFEVSRMLIDLNTLGYIPILPKYPCDKVVMAWDHRGAVNTTKQHLEKTSKYS